MDLLYIDGGESQSPACSKDIQKTRIQYIGMINTKQSDTFYSYISHLFQLIMVSLQNQLAMKLSHIFISSNMDMLKGFFNNQ